MPKKSKKSAVDLYDWYERSVQSPDTHVEWFLEMYKDMRGAKKVPLRLREDFCGTHAICCEWVKSNPKRTAIGFDLDPTTLASGRARHWMRLDKEQRTRVQTFLKDVRTPSLPRVDIQVACNFSFFIFKKRKEILEYFKAVRASLHSDGIFILETAGGPGFIEPIREAKGIYKDKKREFTYVWHQKSYNPIKNEGLYSIHFKQKGKKDHNDAFEYDWRLWSIAELRDLLEDAGFRDSKVYWEQEVKGKATGNWEYTEVGDNAHAWVCYVIGLK